MDAEAREELERTIAASCRAEDYSAAITVALRGYGPELLGYIHAATRSEGDVADVFSLFCEQLWVGLPSFRGESSFRTWAYRVAYRALLRIARTGARRARREVALSEVPEVLAIVAGVRSRTLPHLRSEVKREVARLRESLDADDRTLLILRIDRGLAWNEIATVFEPETTDAESVARASARLRKRFVRIKDKLKALSKDLVLEE